MTFIHLFHQSFMAALAAAGFAVLFRTPLKILAFSSFCGALGVGVRTVLLSFDHLNLQIATATFLSAAVVGFMAEFLSRRLKVPPTLFSVPGVIPMVPGGIMFHAIVVWLNIVTPTPDQFSTDLLGKALSLSGTSFLCLCALVLGIATPTLLLYRRRPEV